MRQSRLGSSVLGAFLGRKPVSKTNVSRAATAAKAASRAAQQREGASQAAGSLESLRQKYTDLQAKFQREIEKVDAALRPESLIFESSSIRPRKTDITVERVVLAWMPYHVGAGRANGGSILMAGAIQRLLDPILHVESVFLFSFELPFGFGNRGDLCVRHRGVLGVECFHCCCHDPGDQGSADPLVISRDDVPGSPLGARGTDRFFVSLHVVIPEGSFGDIGRRELPVLLRVLEPLDQPLALLLFGDVQEKLEDQGAVAAEVVLKRIDIRETVGPEIVD